MKKRPDGRWCKVKTINGKRITFYSGKDTERQAEKDIENQMMTYTSNIYKQSHNFFVLAEKVIALKETTTGFKNVESYKVALKHLTEFYEMDIENIKPSMVQKIIGKMASREYSFSSVSKVKTFLSVVFDYAIVHEDAAIQNFMSSIKIPKSAKKGKVTSPPEFARNKILEYGTNVEFGLWAIMLLCTGLRRGELDALKPSNINFEKNEINPTHSVEFIHNQPHVKDRLKTDASEATVPILDILKPYLVEVCQKTDKDSFIFGGAKPLTETQIKKRWNKYCKCIGCNFKVHQLRHAFALLLYEAGVDVKTAQRLLRHSDIRTTMNIYTDFSNKMTKKAIEKVDMYIENKKQNSSNVSQ